MAFRVNIRGPVGHDRANDYDDVLAVKRLFHGLGRYELPPYGLDGYTDHPLENAIRGFQREHGLREDGWLGPGGPTVRNLEWAVDGRKPRPVSIREILFQDSIGEWGRNRPDDVRLLQRLLNQFGDYRYDVTEEPDGEYYRDIGAALHRFQKKHALRDDGMVRPGDGNEERFRLLAAGSSGSPRRVPAEGELDVAAIAPAIGLLLSGARAAASGIGRALGGAAGGAAAGQAAIEAGRRMDRADPPAPPPGLEPPPPERRDPRTEAPPKPEMQQLPGAADPPHKAEPLIFEKMDDRSFRDMILESNPGSPRTRMLNHKVGELAVEMAKEEGRQLQVVGGGYVDGRYHKELLLKPHDSARVEGRPLKNASWLDVAIADPESKRRLLVNTVDTHSDGQTPRSREQGQAAKVAINKETGDMFIMIPKPRHDVDLEEHLGRYADQIRSAVRELGKPYR